MSMSDIRGLGQVTVHLRESRNQKVPVPLDDVDPLFGADLIRRSRWPRYGRPR